MEGNDSKRRAPPAGRRSVTGMSALAAIQAAASVDSASLGQLSARAQASAAAIAAPVSLIAPEVSSEPVQAADVVVQTPTEALQAIATTAVESAVEELPPNWERHRTSDGQTYYFNVRTEVTSWTLPVEVAEVVEEEAPLEPLTVLSPLSQVTMETVIDTPTRITSLSVASPDSGVQRARTRRQSISAFEDGSLKYAALPAAFTGADGLVMPNYLATRASGVTLPSRLEVLGNRDYKLMSVVSAKSIGNSVLGFHYDAETYMNRFCCSLATVKTLCCCFARPPTARPVKQLYVLPYIFSKAMARVSIFVLLLLLFVSIIQILNMSGTVVVNVGRAWMIGTGCSLLVILILSLRKYKPDGVMSFCRSMGVPEVEEMMFSYSWKVEDEAIRTLAKAVWEAGVGVWIDVVKLCPGDEIRPVVRTMVRSVYKCVVFISPAYITSPNCCVEFWEAVQYPNKLIICVLEPLPADVMTYLKLLVRPEQIVDGIESLIPLLDREVENHKDRDAYKWWQGQKISGGGVPSNVVPSADWPVGKFSLTGRMFTPDRSLSVGPAFLAGDCSDQGTRMRWPWLFIITVFGLAVNIIDIYIKFTKDSELHTYIDYVWLVLLGVCDLAPLIAWKSLWDTRVYCDAALRPLLASRSLAPGVFVRIIGNDDDPTVIVLRDFLRSIGHLDEDAESKQTQLAMHTDNADIDDVRKVINVEVMNSIAHRDRLFGSDEFPFDPRRTLFLWTGDTKDGMPFGRGDPIGLRLMRFLVLIKDWEKENMAESLFSAIGMRVVDVLHSQ